MVKQIRALGTDRSLTLRSRLACKERALASGLGCVSGFLNQALLSPLFSGGELLAAFGQFVLYLEVQVLADLVADQANDDDYEKDGGKDANGEPYAAQGADGLHGVGAIAVAGKQPAGHGAAQAEAGFEAEQDGGVDHAGDAAASLPFGIIHNVGEHRPDERNGGSVGERAGVFENE